MSNVSPVVTEARRQLIDGDFGQPSTKAYQWVDALCAELESLASERQGVAPPPDKSEDRALSVTRLEVIDEEGRALTRRPCEVELSWQDDDRTLKVFVKGGRQARQETPPAPTSPDLPTDVDTLRRLRDRVEAALDEKYTHKVVEPPVQPQKWNCKTCGSLYEGDVPYRYCYQHEHEWEKTDPELRARGAAERSPAPQGTKNDDDDHARVDGVPEGEHGDLPRPATR